MNNQALVQLSACQMLEGFASGAFTPGDLLSACLEQIAEINPVLNALTALDTERAVAEADRSTIRWRNGRPDGVLDGLPIGVKDLQETEGLLTTYGSPMARSNVPVRDAPMVARLRQAGAIVLAKTNVPEYGAGGNTRNPVWGATGNPFDATLVAGGSSGGSAAALAADLVPLCTGSDTGGSLRLPAALCGVTGFRPSIDVIAHPTRPLGWSGISVLGPMARDMDDLILMLRVCEAHHKDDPLSSSVPGGRFRTLTAASLGGLKVGVSEDFGDVPVDASIRQTFRRRIDVIAPHVASCGPVDMNLGDMDRAFDILRAESFLSAFEAAVDQNPENFAPQVVANVELGRQMTLSDRAWAHAEQTRILRSFNQRMQEVDVILMPTSSVSPFPWTQSHVEHVDGQEMDNYYRWLALTYRGSLMGGPAITIPAGLDSSGMPFGLQILGPLGGDAALLSAAKSIETLFAQNEETARPRPDLARLIRQSVELKSIVTHPPIDSDVEPPSVSVNRTAV